MPSDRSRSVLQFLSCPGLSPLGRRPRGPLATRAAAPRACAVGPYNVARRHCLQILGPLPLAFLPGQVHADAQQSTASIDPSVDPPNVTTRVYFDVTISSSAIPRRFVVDCYGDLLPRTVENFVALASLPASDAGYASTRVYRIVPGLTVQMGDVLRNGGKSGAAAGGGSIEGEAAVVKHSVPGLVSMARGVGGKVDSRFFITTRPGDSGYLDVPGREYVAFGRVVEGYDVVLDIERVGARGGDSKPLSPVTIVGCGVL